MVSGPASESAIFVARKDNPHRKEAPSRARMPALVVRVRKALSFQTSCGKENCNEIYWELKEPDCQDITKRGKVSLGQKMKRNEHKRGADQGKEVGIYPELFALQRN